MNSRESSGYGNLPWSPLLDTYVAVGEVNQDTLRESQ